MGQTWTKKLNSELKLKFVDVRVWICRNLRQPNTQRVKTDRKVLIQEPVPSLKHGTMLGSTLQTSSIICSRFLFFSSNRLRKNYTYTFTLKFLAFHLFIIYIFVHVIYSDRHVCGVVCDIFSSLFHFLSLVPCTAHYNWHGSDMWSFIFLVEAHSSQWGSH